MFSALQNLFKKFSLPLTLLSHLRVSTNPLTFADGVTVRVIL